MRTKADAISLWSILLNRYLKGGELFDKLIVEKRFSETYTAFIMHQLLSAVAYCHSKHIVHRDLKPENLLFESSDKNSQIKVVDFGTSQIFKKVIRSGYKYGTIYYIAPEILSDKYNEKCDIWSCGVIMYILLCGYPPFNGSTDSTILNKIRLGRFRFKPEIWSSVSHEAKDLITKMLVYNPNKRITAEEALGEKWFANNQTIQLIEADIAKKALNNLKQFHFNVALQKAVYIYISSQLSSSKERDDLKRIFQTLDKNGDGKLSKDELKEGYHSYFGIDIDDDQLNKLIANIDVDNNGYIDYTEFSMSAVDQNILISEERLQMAYKLFDIDGNGLISATELKSVLGVGMNIDEAVWDNMIKEVDLNSDGGISYKEFKQMMKKCMA
jgi:calcium-dependent protein kinase